MLGEQAGERLAPAGAFRDHQHAARLRVEEAREALQRLLGAAIERATRAMAEVNPVLPIVYRTDMVEACRNCEYARKCLGEPAVASEFPIGDPAA